MSVSLYTVRLVFQIGFKMLGMTVLLFLQAYWKILSIIIIGIIIYLSVL